MKRNGRRGAAMVEFGLSLIVLVPIIYGTIQYGCGFFIINDIANAARSGARYASMRPMDGADLEGFKRAVQQRTAEGSPGGLTPDIVSVEIGFDRDAPARVTVGVKSIPIKLVAWTLPPGRPLATFPYLGEWTPAPAGGRP